MFIPFRTEGTTVLFDTYVPPDHESDFFSHTVLTDDEVEWDSVNVNIGQKHAVQVQIMCCGNI